jgi:hypothetical protein
MDNNNSNNYNSNNSRGGLIYNIKFNYIFKANTASL